MAIDLSNIITVEDLDRLEKAAAGRTPGALGAQMTCEGINHPDLRRSRIRLAVFPSEGESTFLHEGDMEKMREGDWKYLVAAWDNLPKLVAEVHALREELGRK